MVVFKLGMESRMQQEPANKASLVRERLRLEILHGRLLPGQKLNISELCGRLEVTLPAVREALSALQGEGLVELKAKKGFEVSQFSSQDFAELTQARIEIESICLRLSIASGDGAWEGRVEEALRQLLATQRYTDELPPQMNESWSDLHAHLHEELASGMENRWLADTRRALFRQSERFRRLSVPMERNTRNVDEEHRSIVAAALARDTDHAVELLRQHLQATYRIVAG
ncbi:FCD domain-containing protein [Mesorhizobium sp. M2A.F.Ca.ET.037.01.1.1]|uniref:GntR family transcriptional regulator n=4 Tax=Mesorhizobium TaxID=68287 RepID=UPI000F762B96|nr:GntR family transcriptional regulator [Mesorhizobium sp.]AZO34799.1 GntR family transcriptional regulator [Mesorhizobium sp. M2A.F.Ca.ET.046.03.2.1]RUX22685.1 FCD domain-containing protein [Mesorhizobium sp. M2A.F.Ca.ET.037.01.1.1]RUY13178.1 FCD domain-containing protein [Mesorhizobium sp. M2A.F.Ca.ET.040.01.1.1]RVC71065.1 FCD domain-containing protein [Mesorhizobium sp. M00.F.Ca.ET.038.03.1.1]TGT41887.1 GntR family transcriptional regulator [Mesorhizobium sp. M4B.F.Ca.ET.169.01.1.1]